MIVDTDNNNYPIDECNAVYSGRDDCLEKNILNLSITLESYNNDNLNRLVSYVDEFISSTASV